MKERRKTIIIVDDSSTNLVIAKNILSEHYNALTLSSCETLFKTLENITPDLVLLDVEMPIMNGFEGLKILKSKPETAQIPAIFITSRSDFASEMEGLGIGAVDYIHKPFSPPIMLKRIELHLKIAEQSQEIDELAEDLHILVGERTSDIVALNRVTIDFACDTVEANRQNISPEAMRKIFKYIQKEREAIISDGDSLRFTPKPTTVFQGRQQEYSIKIKEILEEAHAQS